MSSGTLYSYPASFRAQKALIAAKYSGFDLKLADGFNFGTTNKSDEFLKKFPLGKVPALETSNNEFIFESNAIAHYVGNAQLQGSTPVEQAKILQWINFADSEVLPAACTWLFPCLGIMQYNKPASEKAKDDIKKSLKILDDHLLTQTFLVGERITQADITLCCTLLSLYQNVLEPSFRQPYGNVNRWFVTLINQPNVQAVLGKVKLCEKMAQFDAKKFSDFQQKSSKDKGGKAKEEKPQKPKEEKKKQAKQEKPKEAAEEPDETELALSLEPKTKDPFEQFPRGTFNMDEFKRTYSNESESVSIKYFWDKLDKENYSIWFCEYLFPKELTLVFMSCNLISGMFQRLDKMRKNAFASVCLFGEDNKSTISGIWVWRGHELAFPLSEDWQIDYESYSWKKLDAYDPNTKQLVNEYLSWSGDFDGKKFNQGKIFK